MADPRLTSTRSRRWVALAVVSVAQLMVALDATIMNIALPSAQLDLRISDADRQWVITAYTLAFAALLLLGGRIADTFGRKKVFLTGLVGFMVASALGGAAGNLPMLVVGRGLQGAFAAVLTPTALSLLAVTFTEPKERARAFAVYGAIASGGGAVGLLTGGLLTEFASWRWCLYVNVIIGIVAALAGNWVLENGETSGRQRFDVGGVLLVTGGLVAIVYACTQAVSVGWGASQVIVLLVLAVMLLAAFTVWESRAKQPLLPLGLVWERNRGGACVASGLAVVGLFGMSLLLTYHFQAVLGYSPVQAGLAFLPMTAAVAASAFGVASPLLPRLPPRLIIVPGLLVMTAGLLLLTTLTPGSGFLSTIVPAEVLLGAGIGCVITPGFSVATQSVGRKEAGVASAMVNTAQQVGGSLGIALLNTVATAATASYLARGLPQAQALVQGYARATLWGTGALIVAAVLASVLINAPTPRRLA